MRKVNYKSDFDFILKLTDCRGNAVGWPQYDWTAVFWTATRANSFTASHHGDELVNCFEDNGQIHIVCNSPRMGRGVLRVEFHAEIPDAIYPDDVRDTYEPQPLEIELVDGAGDCPTDMEVELMLPYIKGEKGDKGDRGEKGDKGDAFTYADFTEAQIAELQRPATEAAEAANEAAENANTAADHANEVAEEYASVLDSKADRTELSNVYAEEPLTPGNFPDIDTYTREELKKDLFDDMWLSAVGSNGSIDHTHSDEKGRNAPYYLNELWLTYEEALDVMQAGVISGDYVAGIYRDNTKMRTHLPATSLKFDIIGNATFKSCSNIEVINVRGLTIFSDTLAGCSRLRKLRCWAPVGNAQSYSNGFTGCKSLEHVIFDRVYRRSFSLSDSPLISLESMTHILAIAQSGGVAMAITLHPDVFAKLTDETNAEWHSLLALAESKNITFTTV